MCSTVLGQVLAELIDLSRWAAALRAALRRQDLPDVPVLTFANEHAIWR